MLNDIKNDAQTRMGKSIESLKHDLTRIRTGRASTALVDDIKVSYYGSDMPLTQVASVSLSDARTILITPWEKNMVAPIEKALMASDLGITPTTAGTVIRLNMPALTEERRKELAKHVGHEGENAKIAIRNVRRDALQQVKDLLKEKLITEDEDRRTDDEIQKLTDQCGEGRRRRGQGEGRGADGALSAITSAMPGAEAKGCPHGSAPHRHRDGRQRPLGQGSPPPAQLRSQRRPQGRARSDRSRACARVCRR